MVSFIYLLEESAWSDEIAIVGSILDQRTDVNERENKRERERERERERDRLRENQRERNGERNSLMKKENVCLP